MTDPATVLRTRKIDGQEFTVVWSGSSPLPSAEQCQSSLKRSGLLYKSWNEE